jgi:hypothetical protein
MKIILQILTLFLIWFTNLNATSVSTKVVLPSNEISFSKTENVKEESIVKIGFQNFARSSLEVNLFFQKSTSRVSCALVGASHAGERVIVQGAGSFVSKLDNLGLTALKTEINLLDDVAKAKFLDEFAGASDDALRAMNGNTSLVNYWKANGSFIKNKTYPNVGHKVWDDAKNAIITKADPTETKILNAIENQFGVKPLTNNQPVMAGAYCDEIGGNVVVKYNLSPAEKVSFNYNNLDPIIKEHIDYLNFIRQDALNNGKLYEKLYSGVSKDKLIAAGDAASHAEILALDDVVKNMRAQGKFNSRADLSKIQILVKGKAEWGNMCRCPHCFQLSNGVKMIGNE